VVDYVVVEFWDLEAAMVEHVDLEAVGEEGAVEGAVVGAVDAVVVEEEVVAGVKICHFGP
jgi:hypothetical protein